MRVNGSEAGEPRTRIMEAMLRASGERGFRNLTVSDVLVLAEVSRSDFDSCFEAGLEQCFAAAYATEAERLTARMIGSAGCGDSWRAALHAALAELAAYVEAQPERTRALLIEVHLAGEDALAHRRSIFERLSGALDRGRREDPALSPPPLTSLFMVGAVEAAIVSAIGDGDLGSFRRAAPELEQLIADAYFRA